MSGKQEKMERNLRRQREATFNTAEYWKAYITEASPAKRAFFASIVQAGAQETEKFYFQMGVSALTLITGAVQMAERIQAQIERENFRFRACRIGCSYCCDHRVEVMSWEGLAIAEHVRNSWSQEEIAKLRQKLQAEEPTVRGLPSSKHKALGLPCPFLREETRDVPTDEGREYRTVKVCSIYSLRPLSCVAWNSFDSVACADGAGKERGSPIPISPEIFLAARQTQSGMAASMLRHGVTPEPLELREALLEIFEAIDAQAAAEAERRKNGTAPREELFSPTLPTGTRIAVSCQRCGNEFETATPGRGECPACAGREETRIAAEMGALLPVLPAADAAPPVPEEMSAAEAEALRQEEEDLDLERAERLVEDLQRSAEPGPILLPPELAEERQERAEEKALENFARSYGAPKSSEEPVRIAPVVAPVVVYLSPEGLVPASPPEPERFRGRIRFNPDGSVREEEPAK